MPTKKYVRKRKRKRKRGNPTPYQGLIVAPRQLVKFRYRATAQLDATSAAASVVTYRANDLFDPEVATGGGQPLGTDEWSQFYTHFTVIGAQMKATFLPSTDVTTTTPQWCGIQISGQSTVVTTSSSILEQKYTRKKMIRSFKAGTPTTVTSNLSVKKYLGVKDLIDDRANAGTFNLNSPAEQVYFHVFSAPYAGFYNPDAVNLSVEITYLAILHEPKGFYSS